MIKLKRLLLEQSILRVGNRGVAVKILQQQLKDLGYELGSSGDNKDGVDGKFGNLTKTAVLDIQQKTFPNDTKEWDGKVGDKTSKAIELAIKKAKKTNEPKVADEPDSWWDSVVSWFGGDTATKAIDNKDNEFDDPTTASWGRFIPPNIKQMISPKKLTNKDFTKAELFELFKVILAARGRLGYDKTSGDTEYIDYGPKYDAWFENDKANDLGLKQLAHLSLSDNKFRMATTVGRGNWNIDASNPDLIYYVDEYDWNKGGAGRNRYSGSRNIKDSDLTGMDDYEKLQYIKNNSDLSWYQTFRELQHRNAPVTGTVPGKKIRIVFSKKDIC